MKFACLFYMLAMGMVLGTQAALAASTKAYVELRNCTGRHVFTDQAAAGASFKETTRYGDIGLGISEGGANFANGGQIFLNLKSSNNFGSEGLAYLDDYLTFHVAGGGSAVVPVSVGGNFKAMYFPFFSVFLGLGSYYRDYIGSATDTEYGGGGPDPYFPQKGDPTTTGVVGSYKILLLDGIRRSNVRSLCWPKGTSPARGKCLYRPSADY